jgi:hypothetical protein
MSVSFYAGPGSFRALNLKSLIIRIPREEEECKVLLSAVGVEV